MPRASDADGNDDMMTDVTNAMGVIQLPDDHAQVAAAAAASKRRPLDAVAEAGQPAPPIPFDRPKFQRGRRADVVCYIEETQSHSVAKNVLFRDYSREFGDVDGALNRVTQAYWPLPFKDRISTIMGHVEICLVLTKCASEQSDDSSTSSDDESFEEEEIVFQVTNRYVAVKVNYSQQMEKLRNKHAEDPLKEIAAMQLIGNDHPNVMGPIEVLFDGQNLDVVMPYAGSGDLFQLLQESQQNSVGFSEPTARYWFRQVMAGIKHLHDKGICHRDISPENVMIDNDGCLIIDMGMALRIPYTDPNAANSVTDITRGSHRRLIRPQGACGKLPYMSPEIFRNRNAFDGCAVDIWTAGTILFCMTTGNRSYQQPHDSDPQYYWMTHDMQRLMTDWNVSVSKECLHLLESMLRVDPRTRLTMEEVMNHPWFAGPEAPPPSQQDQSERSFFASH